MDVVYIRKCRYEIQEPKEVPVWYTGPFQALIYSAFNVQLRLPP
jgi:hypothetical protein